MMAILAPLLFNLSLLLALAVVARRSIAFTHFALLRFSLLGWVLAVVLIAIPALAGFMLGGIKCGRILGHLFYTNNENEKSVNKTVLAWVILLLITLIVSKALPG